jgi:HK97 family phage portal protein
VPVISRIREGWKAFRFPGSSGGGQPWGSATWFGGLFPILPSTRYDYRREAGALYLNGTVWSAIQWLCRTWHEAPSTVYRPAAGGEEEAIRPHPLTELLANPNRWYDASVLWMGTLLSFETDGNAYWYIETSGAGVPVELIYLPHYLIEPLWPKDGSAYRSGYAYRVDGKTTILKPEQVLHFQNGFDPANLRKGLSPLAAELRSICTDNEAQSYSAALLRNMGVPGVVITPKDPNVSIPPAVAEQMKALFRERVQGDNRGEPLIPSMAVEITNPGFSPEQLALDKISRLPVPRICAALGIDPMVLGLPAENKTYANLDAAMEGTYERTLMPLQRLFDSQLNRQLLPRMPGARFGDRLGRDYSKVRALQEDADKLHARLTRAVGGPWMTPDEARAQLGLDPIPGGDTLYPQSSSRTPGGETDSGGVTLRAASLAKAQLVERWRERRLLAERNGHGEG